METPEALRVPEILGRIFERLDDDTVREARAVCRAWHAAASREVSTPPDKVPRYAIFLRAKTAGAVQTPARLRASGMLEKRGLGASFARACANMATAGWLADAYGVGPDAAHACGAWRWRSHAGAAVSKSQNG